MEVELVVVGTSPEMVEVTEVAAAVRQRGVEVEAELEAIPVTEEMPSFDMGIVVQAVAQAAVLDILIPTQTTP